MARPARVFSYAAQASLSRNTAARGLFSVICFNLKFLKPYTENLERPNAFPVSICDFSNGQRHNRARVTVSAVSNVPNGSMIEGQYAQHNQELLCGAPTSSQLPCIGKRIDLRLAQHVARPQRIMNTLLMHVGKAIPREGSMEGKCQG